MLKRKILILLGIISSLSFGESTKIFNFSMGAVNGKAGEYVYLPETSEKISYLDWEIENVPVFILDYKYLNNNFELGINLKKNFNTASSGYMQDYDWYSSYDTEATTNDYGKLSNYSKNKNYVDNILMLDMGAKYWFEHSKTLKSGPILGLKYDYFSFYAKTGDQYNYMLDGSTTIYKGDSSEKCIEYSQEFITPYLGYGISYSYEKLVLDLELKGSWYGKAKANDKHLLRGPMEAKEEYKKVENLILKFVAAYPITESLDITGTFEYSKYFKTSKSTTDFTTQNGNNINDIKDLSGIKNSSYVASIGMTYKI